MCEKTVGNIATYIHTAALQLSHPKVLHLYIQLLEKRILLQCEITLKL